MHAQGPVHHGHVVLTHPAGTHRVVDESQPLLRPAQNVLVGIGAGSGVELLSPPVVEARRGQDSPCQPDTGDQRPAIVLPGQEIEFDPGRRSRICRTQPDPAAAFRSQHAHVAGIAFPRHEPEVATAVVVKQGQEVQLHVRPIQILRGSQERPGLRDGGCQLAAAPEQVAERFVNHARQPHRRQAESVTLPALLQHTGIDVLLQVFSHSGQLMHQLHAGFGKRAPGTDPRQHQQFR